MDMILSKGLSWCVCGCGCVCVHVHVCMCAASLTQENLSTMPRSIIDGLGLSMHCRGSYL